MIKVIEKAVEKVATEWVEKQFAELFNQQERDRWGNSMPTSSKLKQVVERIVDQKIREVTLEHLEKEKIDVKQIVTERLATVKDKIEITVKSY